MSWNTDSNMNVGTNSTAAVSLAMGILSIVVPFLGLMIGIMGVVYARKASREIAFSGEAGSGLATAGFVCSIVGICLQALVIAGYIAFASLTLL